MSFKGKRAIVTGGGAGIGRAIVKGLVQCGAEVLVLARTQADLDSVQAEFPSIQTVCIDVTDIAGVSKVIQDLDDIHFLVNNAAVLIKESFLEIKLESFDKTYDTNVKAPLCIAQAVAHKMIANGHPGSIVNVSSPMSMRARPGGATYGSSKAALNQLTKVMALELGSHQIRVNAVMPTLTWTKMSHAMFKDQPEKAREFIDNIPLGRVAETEDIADAVLYLLSDKASMIHGTLLPVDGGHMVH